jgi:hypothetical protein
MGCTAPDWLVHIDIAVAYLDVESTGWIGAHPCFVCNRRPLAAEIGQRNEVTGLATLAFGKTYFRHGILPHSCPHFAEEILLIAPPLYAGAVPFATPGGATNFESRYTNL